MGSRYDFKSKSELIKMFIDNTPIAYVILDREYRICYINESFAALRQIDIETVIGDKCYNISNAGVKCRNCAVVIAFEAGEKAFLSRKDYMPDGTVRFVDDYAIPLQTDSKGKVEYVLEMMIDRTSEMCAREQRNVDYDGILAMLAALLEAKDTYTATHSDNVRKIAINIASAMGLPESEIFDISVAASLHDIGKVNVPNSILNKPDKLSIEEYDIIKMHPFDSYRMIEGLSSFENINRIVLYHHERMDGLGYPCGLKGEEIPRGARIIAVADTYDAITSTRAYREALSHDYAVTEIKRVAGTQLDEEIVNVMIEQNINYLTNAFYSPTGTSNSQIERVIIRQKLEKQEIPEKAEISTHMKNKIDMKNLLSAIFDCTPCGYLLMDKTFKIIYASQHFLDYLQLTMDEIIDRHCYQAGEWEKKACKSCPVEEVLKNGKVSRMRKSQMVKGVERVFDAYAVPLVEEDGSIEYVIEIVIDRLEEWKMEHSRKRDFLKIMGILDDVLDKQKEEMEERRLTNQVIELRKMLNNIK